MSTREIAITLAVALVGTACSANVATPTTIEVDARTDSHSVEVSPEAGGQLLLDDGASVTIQPGTVLNSTTMSLTRLSEGQPVADALPEDSHPVGSSYDFDAGGYGDFEKPVLVTLPYDRSLIPPSLDESDLGVLHKTEDGWEYLPALAVDAAQGLVTFHARKNAIHVVALLGALVLGVMADGPIVAAFLPASEHERLAITPETGTHSTIRTVSASDLWPRGEVTIYYLHETQSSAIESWTGKADASGRLTTTFEIPPDAPSGTFYLGVTDIALGTSTGLSFQSQVDTTAIETEYEQDVQLILDLWAGYNAAQAEGTLQPYIVAHNYPGFSDCTSGVGAEGEWVPVDVLPSTIARTDDWLMAYGNDQGSHPVGRVYEMGVSGAPGSLIHTTIIDGDAYFFILCRELPSGVQFAWAAQNANDPEYGFSQYRGTTNYTGYCWDCDPPDSFFVENHDFNIQIEVWPQGVANDLYVSRGRGPVSPYPEGLVIWFGPGYDSVQNLSLTEGRLILTPNERYPFALDLTKSLNAEGQTIIQGSATAYELLANGDLRPTHEYHIFTVALQQN